MLSTMKKVAERQSFSSAGDRVGLAFIATAGFASAVSTSVLLAYILWSSFMSYERTSLLHRGIRSFTRSSLGCYLVSLLFCDFIQGSAFAMNYRWAAVGEMAEGRICTIQGAVSEVGDLGAAIWSIAIAFHTFCLLFLVKKPHRLVAPITLACGWTMLILLPILGPLVIQTPQRGSFYGLSGAWCWLGVGYGAERLIYLYFWVFAALGTSFIIYTLIYLRFSGFISTGDDGKFIFTFRRRQLQNASGRPLSISQTARNSKRMSGVPGCFDWAKETRDGTTVTSGTASNSDQASNRDSSPHLISKHLKRVARRLMWYPILYTFVVLPVSICRMGVLAGWTPPFGLFVFAGICFAGSGVSNVILFITTRHSFIKQVAMSRGTRVHVTTQRITVREEGVELGDLNSTEASFPPATPTGKSLTFPMDADGREYGRASEKVSITSQDRDSENDEIEERRPAIHVTVFGKGL